MEELIELIQSGDLTNNQILTRVTTLHNQNCDEVNDLLDKIEALEAQATLNQLATLELKDKLNNAVAKCAKQAKSIEIIEREGKKAVAHAKEFQNRMVIAEAKVKVLEKEMVEFKRQKLRIKRLTAANQSHQKGRTVIKKNMRKIKDELEEMCRENAKLRITGHKHVGKYGFSIYPVKVSAGTAERQIGLIAQHEAGAMKVITRHPETGVLNQPPSHTFKFNKVEAEWINSFFDVCDANDHRYTSEILRLVN
jgi:hypothetical protein